MWLPDMSDDEIGRALFERVVGLLEAEQTRDPLLLAALNRTPYLFSLQRADGHLLAVDTGDDHVLMRGAVRWRHNSDRDAPWRFTVARGVDRGRLQMSGVTEGSIEDIATNIVTTFLDPRNEHDAERVDTDRSQQR